MTGDLLLSGAGSIGFVLVLAAVFSDLGGSVRAEGSHAIGRLESVDNVVRRRVEGTLVWNRLERGETIFDGDAVWAADDAEARIELDDGSSIEIGENSLVVVQRAPAVSSSAVAVEVRRGSATGQARSAPLAIRSGTTSLALEAGSSGKVRLDADRSARVEVESGAATLASGAGKVNVAAGERRLIGADGKTGATETSLGAIQLESPGRADRIGVDGATARVRFRWAASSGDGSYRFELARDEGFRDLVFTTTTDKNQVDRAAIEPGIYHWRVVRGEARSEERKLALFARVSPVLFRPRVGEAVYLPEGVDTSVAFAWTAVPGAERYSLEVDSEKPGAPVLLATADGTFYAHSGELAAGRHCARVRIAQSTGASWSKPTCFQVVKAMRLPAPRLLKQELVKKKKTKKKGGAR